MARTPAPSNNVAQWRKLYGIKQSVLARRAGLHTVTLSDIERGASEPRVGTAVAIADALSHLSGRSVWVESIFGPLAAEQLDHAKDARGRTQADGSATPRADLIDAAPFAGWLREVMGRDEANATDLARRLGVSAQLVRAVLRGRQRVARATVEKALNAADGFDDFRDLYPDA